MQSPRSIANPEPVSPLPETPTQHPGMRPGFDLPPERPLDDREPVLAEQLPPPIAGGTLLATRDGTLAVVADPDRDRLTLVDLAQGRVAQVIELPRGAEPGRLVEDQHGRVHVVLRGTGELATLDLAARELSERRAVCRTPRGVGYEAASDMLHVACLEGTLVSLPAAGGEPARSVSLGADLRDVTVNREGLHVTRFRAAELIALDAQGEARETRLLRPVRQLSNDPFTGEQLERSFEPNVARRAVALGDDRVAVLHQRSLVDAIELSEAHAPPSDDPGVMGPPGRGETSAYGGGGDEACTSIVQTAVSVVSADGSVVHTRSVAGMVLPVDLAVSADGRFLAVADAGKRDETEAPMRGASPSVRLIDMRLTPLREDELMDESCDGSSPGGVQGQPVAVAFSQDGSLLVQTREPAALHIVTAELPRMIELGGASVRDTGHDLFHRDAGAGIACAGCHAEGGDDAHVWNFDSFGLRRTQSVNIGLQGTTPFHWAGDMADLPMLVSEVFVGRMGGAPQSQERVEALSRWLFAQRSPSPIRVADDPAVARGKALFESEAAACGSCHSGDKLTNNETVDVGTGEPLQVPSLIGVAYRTPLIHDGCAADLHARFEPGCGGDNHGNTAGLSAAQIDDLVAYLESL